MKKRIRKMKMKMVKMMNNDDVVTGGCGHKPQLCDCTCYEISAETKGTLYSAKGGEMKE